MVAVAWIHAASRKMGLRQTVNRQKRITHIPAACVRTVPVRRRTPIQKTNRNPNQTHLMIAQTVQSVRPLPLQECWPLLWFCRSKPSRLKLFPSLNVQTPCLDLGCLFNAAPRRSRKFLARMASAAGFLDLPVTHRDRVVDLGLQNGS